MIKRRAICTALSSYMVFVCAVFWYIENPLFCTFLNIYYALTIEFLHILWYNYVQKWRTNYEKI